MILLNELSTPDILFFVLCFCIIGVIVGVYFLIPVLNKKQYAEQRENLRKREAVFRKNRGEEIESEENETDQTVEEVSNESTEEQSNQEE